MLRVCNAFLSFPSHPVLKVSATGRRSGKNVRKVNEYLEGVQENVGRKRTRSQRPAVYSEYLLFLPLPPLPDSSTKNSPFTSETGASPCCLAVQLFVLLNALHQHVPQIQWQTNAFLLLFALCGVYK